ncbi:MAG: OmpH family outer membrane protein [Chlamydiota bacterium]
MKIKSFYLTLFLIFVCLTAGYAKEKQQQWPCGVVDFETCLAESKHGQNEQKIVQETENKMKILLEDKEKEIAAIGTKLSDPELLDSLSPEAEEELKIKYQTLSQEYGYYHNQLLQSLQQAKMESVRALVDDIKGASQTVSKEKHIPFIIRKDACFSFPASVDITALIIEVMDRNFDSQQKKPGRQLSGEAEAMKTTTTTN